MPRTNSWALVVALVLLATIAPTGAAQSAPATKGSLIIVGGGERPPTVTQRFLDLAGGRGHARIAVIPMASAEAAETGRELAAEFDSLGARSFVLLIDRTQAESEAVAHQLDSATGIWFSGGDQTRLTPILAGTATLRAMLARYRAGAVVGGTSAGAAIMSEAMITGNQKPPSDTAGYYGDEYPTIARKRIDVATGFAFLTNAIVDQHFIRRERHNRLLSAVLERPQLLGVGIDESTALEVRPDGTWRVLGASAAVVYDARAARITPVGDPLLGATEIRTHVLPAGSTFDPKTGRGRLPGS